MCVEGWGGERAQFFPLCDSFDFESCYSRVSVCHRTLQPQSVTVSITAFIRALSHLFLPCSTFIMTNYGMLSSLCVFTVSNVGIFTAKIDVKIFLPSENKTSFSLSLRRYPSPSSPPPPTQFPLSPSLLLSPNFICFFSFFFFSPFSRLSESLIFARGRPMRSQFAVA